MAWRVSGIDRDRYAEWAALAACAALAALALWLVIRLIWLLLPRSDDALTSQTARVGVDAGSVPAQSIAKWHLFGNTPRADGAGGSASALSMILSGTLADGDPRAGIAVISGGERGERAYRVGETIGPGLTLARVYPDSVVVLHDGSEETLKLSRDRNLAPADIVRARPAPGARASSKGATAATSPGGAARAPSAAPVGRAPANWQQTVERLRQNPDELARRVQVVPVLDNGRLSGVRVSAGADMALIQQLGLRPGDVVTAVNGAPVDSIARGQQILDSLRSASSARVTVLRDGKPTDLTIGLK